jgi:TrmH family RNA methyltransferase
VGQLPGTTVALAARAGEPLHGGIAGDLTLLVGAEREGLSAAVLEQADVVSHIPIRTESLNAAMAATVALYELTRTAPTS